MFSPSRCLATAKEIDFVEMVPGTVVDIPGLIKTASGIEKFKWKVFTEPFPSNGKRDSLR
jgi:hypothetical protein